MPLDFQKKYLFTVAGRGEGTSGSIFKKYFLFLLMLIKYNYSMEKVARYKIKLGFFSSLPGNI
jgi:hypothetical protein